MHRRASPAVLDQLGPLAKASGAPKLLIGHWRGDVAHLRDADLIVALGAPTIPPASIRRRLLQTGQAEAAAQPRDWGKLPWQATTAAGQTVLMPRMGYRHSAWQEAYAKALYTCVCRTLALIGKPAVLLTDEQLDFPVVQPPHRLSRRDAKILSALHVAAVARGGDTSETKTPKLLEDIYGDSLLAVLGFISAKCHPILAETLASLTGLKTKTVAGRLTVLRAPATSPGTAPKVGRCQRPPGRRSTPRLAVSAVIFTTSKFQTRLFSRVHRAGGRARRPGRGERRSMGRPRDGPGNAVGQLRP